MYLPERRATKGEVHMDGTQHAPVETLLAKERAGFEKKYKGAQISVEVAP